LVKTAVVLLYPSAAGAAEYKYISFASLKKPFASLRGKIRFKQS
jgi:hypothetical protein